MRTNLSPRYCSRTLGFTLAEIMTAMVIFSLVVVGMVYSHLFGLRMYNITATKLSASAGARAALNRVRDDIRSCKSVYVGNGDGNGFSNLPANQLRVGNAVQIYPTASTNGFVRYFLDTGNQNLMRVDSGSTAPTTIAAYITNQVAFSAEDYVGNVLTNDQNNRVIQMTLDFYQWEFPVAQIAPGAYYDHYRLQTRITRRTIE